MSEITLPWPPKELSPNWRGHWAPKAKAAKKYRRTCWACALGRTTVDWEGSIDLNITFYPPDKRRRDYDNLLASIKSGLDGLADALKVNDSRFCLNIARSSESLSKVVVSIRPRVQI